MKRLANNTDLDSVYEIYMHESVIPFLTYDPMEKSEFKSIYQNMLKPKNFFVYELDQEVAGFYSVQRWTGRAAHVAMLGSLAIKPSHHGTGVATQIIKELIDELKQKDIKRIELIVESDNPKAIRFYEKLGFEKEGTLRNFYKRSHQESYVDDYIMSILI